MMLRPMAMIRGLIVLTAPTGPATAKISFPAAATALAPNTGAAINAAPYSPRRDVAHLDVPG